MIGKSRVAPLKYITTSRMELVAAALSVKISGLLKRELQTRKSSEQIVKLLWAPLGMSPKNSKFLLPTGSN